MCDRVTGGKGSSGRGSVIGSGEADPSTISALAIGMAGVNDVHLRRIPAKRRLKCKAEGNPRWSLKLLHTISETRPALSSADLPL